MDEDVGVNGEVEYSIIKGAEGKFDIHPRTGAITVRSVFSEMDENREFTLLVQATDKGNHGHLREVIVLVKANGYWIFVEIFCEKTFEKKT